MAIMAETTRYPLRSVSPSPTAMDPHPQLRLGLWPPSMKVRFPRLSGSYVGPVHDVCQWDLSGNRVNDLEKHP